MSRSQTLKDLVHHEENSRFQTRDGELLKDFEQRTNMISFTFE